MSHTANRQPIHTDYKQAPPLPQPYQQHNVQQQHSLRPPQHHNAPYNHNMPQLDTSPRSGNSSNGTGSSGILMSPHSSSPTHSNDVLHSAQYNTHPVDPHAPQYNGQYMSHTIHHTPHQQHMIVAALHADMDTRTESEREADRLVYMERMQCLWEEQLREVQHIDFRHVKHTLPLARIKKIMKSDEDVRMISAEAPIVFAKACELFILDLTTKAWQQTYAGKRRTLNKGDVAEAIAASDIFDFLEPVVPKGSYDSSTIEEAEEWDFNVAVEEDGMQYDDSYDSYPTHMPPPNQPYYANGRVPSNGSSGSGYSSGSTRPMPHYNQPMPPQHYDNRYVQQPAPRHNSQYSAQQYAQQPHYDNRRTQSELPNLQSPPAPHEQYQGVDLMAPFQPVA